MPIQTPAKVFFIVNAIVGQQKVVASQLLKAGADPINRLWDLPRNFV